MSFDRRQFLKTSSVISLSSLFPSIIHIPQQKVQHSTVKNIIILVFDALSGKNLSLFGYPRQTDMNIKRFADHANIYHNHFAGGTFTTPGTASLFTGVYPFTHRAVHFNGITIPYFNKRNIFTLFNDHYSLGYTHNPLASTLINQISNELDTVIPVWDLYMKNNLINTYIPQDQDIGFLSWARVINEGGHSSNSLFLSELIQKVNVKTIGLEKEFPRGLPTHRNSYFTLEHAIDWLLKQLSELPQPFLLYIHLFPPHDPYNTRREFIDAFLDDGYQALKKPKHFFHLAKSDNEIDLLRRYYDEYILYLDQEFGRLYDQMQQTGLLRDSWLIFTSDHGEMFERGIYEHGSCAMFEPLVRIPLIISAPGQLNRNDVYTPTSVVDVLPTLLHMSGKTIPDWCEGTILPPFNPQPVDMQRQIYTLDAKRNQRERLTKATAVIVEWPYKLILYKGFPQAPGEEWNYFEMFNLENDPEELNNLYSKKNSTAVHLSRELIEKLNEADQVYLTRASD